MGWPLTLPDCLLAAVTDGWTENPKFPEPEPGVLDKRNSIMHVELPIALRRVQTWTQQSLSLISTNESK